MKNFALVGWIAALALVGGVSAYGDEACPTGWLEAKWPISPGAIMTDGEVDSYADCMAELNQRFFRALRACRGIGPYGAVMFPNCDLFVPGFPICDFDPKTGTYSGEWRPINCCCKLKSFDISNE